MVQRRKGCNASFKQGVNETIIIIQPLLIDGSTSLRNYPWPRKREAIGVDAELAHQRDVFLPTVIMITCHIPVVVPPGFSRGMRKGIPDALTTAIGGYPAFNLIPGCRCAPQKTVAKISPVKHCNSFMYSSNGSPACGHNLVSRSK